MAVPYELLGGEAGVRNLASVFYDVMDELTEAETIRKMHADNLVEIKEKLYEYLSGWLGGPPVYADKHGVCLTKPHKPYAIGPAERDQWLLCMDEALLRVDASAELRAMLKGPMYAVADAIRNTDGSAACPSEHDDHACEE
jgi:hemoglobin